MEHQTNDSVVSDLPQPQPKQFTLEVDKSLAPTFALFAFITALVYTVSFTGVTVYPQLSFFIFCCGELW